MVQINHKHESVNVFGVRLMGEFLYIFAKRKRQQDFIRLLRKLLEGRKGILLFVDNARIHHGRLVQKFLRKHKGRIKLEFFPPYTPELNPVEPCWKPARKDLSNRLLHTLPAAKYHLRNTFNDPTLMPKFFEYLRD